MEVFFGLDKVPYQKAVSMTVGSFDGVHLGHQKILKRVAAKEENFPTVLTFDPHPQAVLKPQSAAPPLLSTMEERLHIFEKNGIQRLIVVKFTNDFAKLTPEQFIRDVLIEKLGMKYIAVGPNHQFGKGRKGSVVVLESLAERYGFEMETIEPVSRFNQVISSTYIRKVLATGDALTAWRCLGRPFYLNGKVIRGDGRGKRLGYPTANLELEDAGKLMPPEGIYATIAEIDGYRMPSVSHFGARPTFKDAKPSIETHIIGYQGNIYGHTLHLGIVDRMRDIAAFPNVIELVRQMILDRAYAKRRLAELGFSNDARMRIQRYGKIQH